ncbi:MAG TPA: hypothetical protein VJ302_06495 [Blastocatellia bacterium]|nr:hypothetical protein [Blastocatellia bacterium]
MASWIQKLRSKRASQGFWALSNQGILSLGTFLTSVAVARSLPPAEYGTFAIICGVTNFLNSMHSAVVIVPMLTRSAGGTTDEARRIAAGSMVLTAVLMLPLLICGGATAWALGRPELALWTILAMICWQFQETIRRVFMARLRHGEAAWGDALSYLGQAALIWGYSSRWPLSARNALIMMAFTSGVAGLIQTFQHGVRWMPVAQIIRLGETYWKLGRWVLLSNFSGVLMTQSYPWMLAVCYGTAASAQFQALINILGISHPVSFGIGGLLYPVVAQANGAHGQRAAIKVGLSYGLQGGLLLLPFYLLITIWPHGVLQTFYGAQSPYLELTGTLRLFALAYSISYLSHFMTVILNSLELTKIAFYTQVVGIATLVVVGLPLTIFGGVVGAVVASGLTTFTRLMVSGFYLTRSAAQSSSEDLQGIRNREALS